MAAETDERIPRPPLNCKRNGLIKQFTDEYTIKPTDKSVYLRIAMTDSRCIVLHYCVFFRGNRSVAELHVVQAPPVSAGWFLQVQAFTGDRQLSRKLRWNCFVYPAPIKQFFIDKNPVTIRAWPLAYYYKLTDPKDFVMPAISFTSLLKPNFRKVYIQQGKRTLTVPLQPLCAVSGFFKNMAADPECRGFKCMDPKFFYAFERVLQYVFSGRLDLFLVENFELGRQLLTLANELEIPTLIHIVENCLAKNLNVERAITLYTDGVLSAEFSTFVLHYLSWNIEEVYRSLAGRQFLAMQTPTLRDELFANIHPQSIEHQQMCGFAGTQFCNCAIKHAKLVEPLQWQIKQEELEVENVQP